MNDGVGEAAIPYELVTTPGADLTMMDRRESTLGLIAPVDGPPFFVHAREAIPAWSGEVAAVFRMRLIDCRAKTRRDPTRVWAGDPRRIGANPFWTGNP
jgi:hypothetical protein